MGNTTSETDALLNITHEASCTEQLIASEWNKIAIVVSFVVLGLINVMVIVGNTLVIMAVFLSTKLRTVTNLFIVSLAVSDLMVGIAVLPFSTVYEVLELWIFGNIWCQIWLAVDVWMCTASILNLCAISLDRYVAVTRPVSYPSIMSSKRAKILIAIVWCVSFVICLPPLVGWSSAQSDNVAPVPIQSYVGDSESNEVVLRQGRYLQSYHFTTILERVQFEDALETMPSRSVRDLEEFFEGNVHSSQDDNVSIAINVSDATDGISMCTCQLTTDKGYRIYSALGSFYLPMLVMMFFYCRIYRAAVETTRAINQGFRTTKSGSNAGGGRFDEQRLTLRIHRGRSSGELYRKSNGSCESSAMSFRGSTRRVRNSSFRESPTRVERAGIGGMTFPPSSDKKVRALIKTRQRSSSRSTSSGNVCTRLNPYRRRAQQHWTTRTATVAICADCAATEPSCVSQTENTSTAKPPSMPVESEFGGDRVTDDQNELDRRGPQMFSKMGKRNIKAQVKRFRNETKAAKTLGIIVGGFILCWLPFFTIYLTAAFCADDCIPKALFAVFFWLGYCNSALNPCVYALFSRDFRHAFQRILCRCFMRKDHSVKQRIVTMFPANLHLASFFEESEEGSNSY